MSYKYALTNSQAEMILAAASLNSDFAYAPTNKQVVGVFLGIIIFHGMLNTLNTAWLARITTVFLPRSLLTKVLCLPKYRLHLRCHHSLSGNAKGQK